MIMVYSPIYPCMQVPEMDAIITSVSGGGLLAGVAVVAKVHRHF